MALPAPSSLVPPTQDLPGHTFPWGPREKTVHKTFQAQRTSNNRLFLGAGRSPQLPGASSANETAPGPQGGQTGAGRLGSRASSKERRPWGGHRAPQHLPVCPASQAEGMCLCFRMAPPALVSAPRSATDPLCELLGQ